MGEQTPFAQKLTWTLLAVGLYVTPFLVDKLAQAEMLGQLGMAIVVWVWVPRQHELRAMAAERKKKRESNS